MKPEKTEKSKQVNIRLTLNIFDLISKIAADEGLSNTDIVTRAVNEFIERKVSQICQGCKSYNKLGANYCSNCGLPLNPEGLEEFKRMSEYFHKMTGNKFSESQNKE
jgi:hypothetical protein